MVFHVSCDSEAVIIRVQDSLTKVLSEQQRDTIQPSDWLLLKDMHELLEPFAKITTLASGESYVTISSVIPCIHLMKRTLKKHIDKKSPLSRVAKDMLDDLEKRFNHYLDPKHEDHNPIYAVATLLDRRFKPLITNAKDSNELLAATRKVIVAAVWRTIEEASDTETDTDTTPETLPMKEPPSKRPHAYTKMFDDMIEEMEKTDEATVRPKRRDSISGRVTAVVDDYIHKVHREADSDPLQFWLSKSTETGLGESFVGYLATYALGILSVPAFSAPTERVFSTAGESTLGKRNTCRLTGAKLEREVLLQRNKLFYIND